MDRTNSPGAKRFVTDSRVHLQFPGEPAPLEAALNNLSEVGIFVVSEVSYPASTEFNFRISGGEEDLAITGRGRVAWRRQLAAGAHRPAGMGCEILRLTEGSRAALKRRLNQSNDPEILREPPVRQSLTKEITQQSLQDALLTQRVERPEYFRTMSGPLDGKQTARNRTALWIAGGIALLALALFGLVTSGLLPNPFATESLSGADATNGATTAPPIASPTPLRPGPSVQVPADQDPSIGTPAVPGAAATAPTGDTAVHLRSNRRAHSNAGCK